MTENAYSEWRKELGNIQTKIDMLEETYWTTILSQVNPLTDDEVKDYTSTYETERLKAVAELEAHFAAEPNH